MYTFDYRGENSAISATLNSSSIFYNGVHHGDDCYYLFPLHMIKNGKLNAADTKISKLFIDFWTSFAINGVPSSNMAPNWPPLISMMTTHNVVDVILIIFFAFRIHWTLFTYKYSK